MEKNQKKAGKQKSTKSNPSSLKNDQDHYSLRSSLQKEEEKMREEDSQPKLPKKIGRPEKPLPDLLNSMFDYDSSSQKYFCRFYPSDGCQKRYIYFHLLTDRHRLSVRKEDIQKLNQAIAYFEEKKSLKTSDDAKINFLEFLAYGLKANLSFEQIQGLGTFLKQMS